MARGGRSAPDLNPDTAAEKVTMRCRRLARDYERLPEHSEAMVKWSMVGLMARRPARGKYHTSPTYNW